MRDLFYRPDPDPKPDLIAKLLRLAGYKTAQDISVPSDYGTHGRDKNYMLRKPYIYLPGTDDLYWGHPGMYHDDLNEFVKENDAIDTNRTPSVFGSVYTDSLGTHRFQAVHNVNRWGSWPNKWRDKADRMPSLTPEMQAHIEQRVGVPFGTTDPELTDNFTADEFWDEHLAKSKKTADNGSSADYPQDWFEEGEGNDEDGFCVNCGGPIDEYAQCKANEGEGCEPEQPESQVPKFAPGEKVRFRSGTDGGTIVGDPEVYEGDWWYRVKGDRDEFTYNAAEQMLYRDDSYDQPGVTTINDWFGIPPEGEQYYRTAMTTAADSGGLIFPKNEWFSLVEPHVMEQAKYYHQCPSCGGYLEKRGDFYTCQKCPMEWPPGGERTARNGQIFPVEAEDTGYEGESVWQPGYLFLHSGNVYIGPQGQDHYNLIIPWEKEHEAAGKPPLTPYMKINLYNRPDKQGITDVPAGVHLTEDEMGELPEGVDEWPEPFTYEDVAPHLPTLQKLHPDVYHHGRHEGQTYGMKKWATSDDGWDEKLNDVPGEVKSDPFLNARAFIYSPSGGWIRFGGPKSLHEQVEHMLEVDGLDITPDCVRGRWFPEDDSVDIYDSRLDDKKRLWLRSLIRLNAPRDSDDSDSVPSTG